MPHDEIVPKDHVALIPAQTHLKLRALDMIVEIIGAAMLSATGIPSIYVVQL
jgi:hypothetical protein